MKFFINLVALQGEKISAMLIKGEHFTIAALVGTRKKIQSRERL